jgi:toxin ParE1/3/4
MANKFELTEAARRDLKEIWFYIVENNPASADKTLRELSKKFDLLAQNPKIGSSHDEFILNLRSFPFKNYLIFYFPVENGVEIYRVIHGARNIEDLFEDFFRGLES